MLMTLRFTLTWKILIQRLLTMKYTVNLKKSSIWLKMNKLFLNKQTTKMMVFHRKQMHIKELNIAINGAKIKHVEFFFFMV